MPMTEVDLRIDGMHCSSCIRRVTRSLQTLPGVEVEEVRLGAARIKLLPDTSASVVISGLGKAGYAAYQEK
jgi:copper chaperone CopZ